MRQEITCPKCLPQFPLDEAFGREVETNIRQQLTSEFETREQHLAQRVKEEALAEARRESAELRTKVDAQHEELVKARAHEVELLRIKAQLEEQAQKALLDARRELDQEREKIREAAKQQVLDEHRLKDAEQEKRLADLRREIDQLKHKAEQGSQQLQGDVQELELEKALRENFPTDKIEPINTGVRGADILQNVVSDDGRPCGSILWESKRVRNWSYKFVEKLLQDKAAQKADVAVLVIDAMPHTITHLGSINGVLVTRFGLAICLAATLRVNIALLGQTRLALSGREDQKSKLFEYFAGPQFHELIVWMAEQLNQMQTDLSKEKAAFARMWSKREQQIHSVLSGAASLTGTLQSLVGKSLPPVAQFELTNGGEE